MNKKLNTAIFLSILAGFTSLLSILSYGKRMYVTYEETVVYETRWSEFLLWVSAIAIVISFILGVLAFIQFIREPDE